MLIHKLLVKFSFLLLLPILAFAEEDPSIAFQREGMPSIHNLTLNLTKNEAIKVISAWPVQGREVTPYTEDTRLGVKLFSMGYDHTTSTLGRGFGDGTYTEHNYSAYDEIYFDSKDAVTGFSISGRTVNGLFNTQDMDFNSFVQAFVDSYSWINTLNYNGNNGYYEFSNHSQGWKIGITTQKKITIMKIKKVSTDNFK